MRTGDIVRISGAYFKNDNGIYFIENSPGDASWCGSDYCLKKISKTGKISISKHNICFWPIAVFVNDLSKSLKAKDWNEKNAKIETIEIKDISAVVLHFENLIESNESRLQRDIWDFGNDSKRVIEEKEIIEHYKSVIQYIKSKTEYGQ